MRMNKDVWGWVWVNKDDDEYIWERINEDE